VCWKTSFPRSRSPKTNRPAFRSRPLQVVVLHCHFERGGVTQVVENHVHALASASVDRLVLVSGPRVSGLSATTRAAVTQVILGDFDYDVEPNDFAFDHPTATNANARPLIARAAAISRDLQQQLAALGIKPDNAVLHWHNHSLGKNTAAPQVIRNLIEAGWALLLQIHDFAEDNRPENYRRLIQASASEDRVALDRFLYPVSERIHYATLTRADATALCELGIPPAQTHVLPNSVTLSQRQAGSRQAAWQRVRSVLALPAQSRWCLYPVRGIRRKNVGEFLLLCRWLPEHTFGGLTLCPDTPIERQSYLRWKQVASELSPRAVFDAAHHEGVSFTDHLAAADFIVSTSVAEGFGMAFLEPWLAGRHVIARHLPVVMDDFVSAGMRFPFNYTSIPVPGEPAWLEQCHTEFVSTWQQAWSAVPAAFRPHPPPSTFAGDAIDFAHLIPLRQAQVLSRADRDPGFEREMQQRSRSVVDALRGGFAAGLIEENAAVVAREYSLEGQADQLYTVYRHLLDTAPRTSAASAGKVGPSRAGDALALISATRPFYPCRTESMPPATRRDKF